MATKQSLRPSAGQNPSVTEYEMAFCGQHAPTAIRSSTYGDLYVPRVATYRYGRRALFCCVRSTLLWNQFPAAARATCTDTSDCFKRALKASPVLLSGRHVADHSTSEELSKGGSSEVHNINITSSTNAATDIKTTGCFFT